MKILKNTTACSLFLDGDVCNVLQEVIELYDYELKISIALLGDEDEAARRLNFM